MKPEDFNQNKYKRTSWSVKLHLTSSGEVRMVVFVTTGRKEWPLFSVVPDFGLGEADPVIKEIRSSFKYYTMVTLDRLKEELNVMLSDVYGTKIEL
jgi:hypothetical protein